MVLSSWSMWSLILRWDTRTEAHRPQKVFRSGMFAKIFSNLGWLIADFNLRRIDRIAPQGSRVPSCAFQVSDLRQIFSLSDVFVRSRADPSMALALGSRCVSASIVFSPLDDISSSSSAAKRTHRVLGHGSSSFVPSSRVLLSVPSFTSPLSRRRTIWRCESRSSSSNEHIPKQFREENLKDGCECLVNYCSPFSIFSFLYIIWFISFPMSFLFNLRFHLGLLFQFSTKATAFIIFLFWFWNPRCFLWLC